MDDMLHVSVYPEPDTSVSFSYAQANEDELLWLTMAGDVNALRILQVSDPDLRFNPYHGKDGKFASSGNGATGSSEFITKSAANELVDRVRTDGGFTYDVNRGVHEADGYSVSPYPNRSEEVPLAELNGHTVEQYVDKNADLLARQDHMLGGWHDTETGTVWLDVTVVLHDKTEAIDMGKVFNQIAIFDLAKGIEIPTGGTGRSKRSLTPSRVERDVSHGGKACAQCAANTNPDNVPVHPGCMCNIETKEVTVGISPEEVAGLMEMHAASSMAGVTLDDFPQAITLDGGTGAAFHLSDFRFGDLVSWSAAVGQPDAFTVLLRDKESVGVFKAFAGMGLYLYIAYDERDHDGAIIVGPDAGVEGLAQAYSLLMEGDQ